MKNCNYKKIAKDWDKKYRKLVYKTKTRKNIKGGF